MAEVAELLMKIGFRDEASSGLLRLSQTLIGIANLTTKIEQGIGSWSVAIKMVGAVLVASAIAKGFEDIAAAGAKVNEQLNLMIGRGVPAATQLDVMAKAMKLTQAVPTTTLSENIKRFNEYEYALGTSEAAMEKMEDMARIDLALNKLTGNKSKNQGWALLKMLEETGHLEPGQFEEYANAVARASIATGGMVTPQHFMMTTKYGRSAALGWDPEFIGGYLPSFIQRLNSGGAGGGGQGGPGNAFMSAYAELAAGHISKEAQGDWVKYGLGNPKSDDPETVEMLQKELFRKNPYKWVQNVMMPALAKANVDTNDVAATTEVINKLFPNRVAGQVMAIAGTQGSFVHGQNSKLEQDKILNERAMNARQYSEQLLHHDVGTIMERFSAGFENLLQTLGNPMMAPDGPITKMMDSLAGSLTSLNKSVAENPEMAKVLEVAAAGLGLVFATMAAGIVIAGFTMFAPGGVAFVALMGLAALMAKFSGENGDGFIKFLAQGNWLEAIKELAGRKDIETLANMLDGLKKAFLWMQEVSIGNIAAGIDKFTEAMKNLWEFIQKIYSYLKLENYLPGHMYNKSSFNPSNGGNNSKIIQLALNLDGRVLAQAVSDEIEDLHTHPTQAATPNGWTAFRAADGNFATT